ncbi:MAG: hypothetical protein HC927_00750 [Deltaproteobacteria bacterium]|nr:hypothetical protein [Deltaproteobacteria bacterium]
MRIVGLGPFEDLELDLCERPGEPRLLTVVYGEGGTGKSTLLSAIAATRPGHHVVQTSVWRRPSCNPHSICHWRLGAEDGERPHPLKVSTPGFSVESDEHEEQLRRRELVHFDRVLADKGGFAFIGLPGSRRYPRANLVIGDPARTVLKPDIRGAPGFQDPNGVELTRAIKLILAYAGIASALAGNGKGESGADPRVLGVAMKEALDELLGLVGFVYRGLSPRTFEPRFESPAGEILPFDALPMLVRQLVCFASIPVHQIWAANEYADPRTCEGVVAIDDVELNLSDAVQLELLASLRRVLPRAQWILSTASPALAHSAVLGSTVTLRRDVDSDRVAAYEGELSLTH